MVAFCSRLGRLCWQECARRNARQDIPTQGRYDVPRCEATITRSCESNCLSTASSPIDAWLKTLRLSPCQALSPTIPSWAKRPMRGLSQGAAGCAATARSYMTPAARLRCTWCCFFTRDCPPFLLPVHRCNRSGSRAGGAPRPHRPAMQASAVPFSRPAMVGEQVPRREGG
jgi:hypothetical protein